MRRSTWWRNSPRPRSGAALAIMRGSAASGMWLSPVNRPEVGIEADPARARQIDLGPSVKVGEVVAGARRSVERDKVGLELDEIPRHESRRQAQMTQRSAPSSQLESRHEPEARARTSPPALCTPCSMRMTYLISRARRAIEIDHENRPCAWTIDRIRVKKGLQAAAPSCSVRTVDRRDRRLRSCAILEGPEPPPLSSTKKSNGL